MKCQFDDNGTCRGRVCYSNQECGSRDENGNPIYGLTEKEKQCLRENGIDVEELEELAEQAAEYMKVVEGE